MFMVLDGATTTAAATSAFSPDQVTSITASLTKAAQTILASFIDLLPIIAVIVGVIFGIRFVKSQFNKVKNAN